MALGKTALLAVFVALALGFAGVWVAQARRVRERARPTPFQLVVVRAALGLTLGGIPGVLIAAFLVRSLPLDAVRWLVIVVASYTAVTLLRAARSETQ